MSFDIILQKKKMIKNYELDKKKKKKKRHCLHGIFSLWFKNKILPFLNRPCFSKYLF